MPKVHAATLPSSATCRQEMNPELHLVDEKINQVAHDLLGEKRRQASRCPAIEDDWLDRAFNEGGMVGVDEALARAFGNPVQRFPKTKTLNRRSRAA